MRKIERPDSTTIFFEKPFHLLKDEKEVQNIFGDETPKDVVIFLKWVDSNNFDPMVAFIIKKPGVTLMECPGYTVNLALLGDRKLADNFEGL